MVCDTIGCLPGVIGGTHKLFLSKGEERVLPFPLSQAVLSGNLCLSNVCPNPCSWDTQTVIY